MALQMFNFNSTMFNGNRYLAFLYHTLAVQGFHIRAKVDFFNDPYYEKANLEGLL